MVVSGKLMLIYSNDYGLHSFSGVFFYFLD